MEAGVARLGADLAAAARAASVEATALATEALLTCGQSPAHASAGWQGVEWLIDAVAANRHQQGSPVGFCFANLWYCEKLYPLAMTTAALAEAARHALPQLAPATDQHAGQNLVARIVEAGICHS